MEKRCPDCNALMYERKIKKGPKAGEMGFGCPCCFLLLPEHTPKLGSMYIMLNNMPSIEEDDDFDFWKKPGSDEDEDKSE